MQLKVLPIPKSIFFVKMHRLLFLVMTVFFLAKKSVPPGPNLPYQLGDTGSNDKPLGKTPFGSSKAQARGKRKTRAHDAKAQQSAFHVAGRLHDCMFVARETIIHANLQAAGTDGPDAICQKQVFLVGCGLSLKHLVLGLAPRVAVVFCRQPCL